MVDSRTGIDLSNADATEVLIEESRVKKLTVLIVCFVVLFVFQPVAGVPRTMIKNCRNWWHRLSKEFGTRHCRRSAFFCIFGSLLRQWLG